MLIVRAGLLIDGTGREPQTDVDILIESSTIKEIRPSADSASIATDADVIDCSNLVVLPGFIDLHVHLRNPLAADIAREGAFQFRIDAEPTLAVFYAARGARAAMAAGFTTLRNMGGVEYVSLRRAIELGLIPGPRIHTSGLVLMTGGHTDRTLSPGIPREGRWAAWECSDGIAEVRKRVRQLVLAGVDFIKFDASGGLHYPDIRHYSDEEVHTIVEEAHNLGVRVAAHAHGRKGILQAIKAGVDTLEHGTFLDEECAEEMAKRQTTFVPTLAIMCDSIKRGASWGYSAERIARYMELLKTRNRAVQIASTSGVPIALGSDASGWWSSPGLSGIEFQLLHDAGLSEMDSIRAGTQRAAHALGLQDKVGTIEAGKEADLVATRANPLDDLSVLEGPTNIVMVMRAGDVVVRASGTGNGTELNWQEHYSVQNLQ